MKIIQSSNQPVDVTNWRRDERFTQYPEGARDKTLLYCSISASLEFLKPGHQYLFKYSSHRSLEQYWIEVLAYRLGCIMDIEIPPTFVAYDSHENKSGALIEWFLCAPSLFTHEIYIPGGDLSQQYIPDFDRKKGGKHNFQTTSQIFEDLNKKFPNTKIDWKTYWAKAFVFDALIGNTDRHQDNWGIILTSTTTDMKTSARIRIAPVFDNGTSLGWEIPRIKFSHYDDPKQLEQYISRGWHHMKWDLNDTTGVKHLEMLKKLAEFYPETLQIMLDCLNKVNFEVLGEMLEELTTFNVPVRLSEERAKFMLRLLQFRHSYLLNGLEK